MAQTRLDDYTRVLLIASWINSYRVGFESQRIIAVTKLSDLQRFREASRLMKRPLQSWFEDPTRSSYGNQLAHRRLTCIRMLRNAHYRALKLSGSSAVLFRSRAVKNLWPP